MCSYQTVSRGFFLLRSKTPHAAGKLVTRSKYCMNPVQPKSRVVVGPIECRASHFYGELMSMKTFKYKKDYGILKCEHVERHASRRVKNDINAEIELECTYSRSI